MYKCIQIQLGRVNLSIHFGEAYLRYYTVTLLQSYATTMPLNHSTNWYILYCATNIKVQLEKVLRKSNSKRRSKYYFSQAFMLYIVSTNSHHELNVVLHLPSSWHIFYRSVRNPWHTKAQLIPGYGQVSNVRSSPVTSI